MAIVRTLGVLHRTFLVACVFALGAGFPAKSFTRTGGAPASGGPAQGSAAVEPARIVAPAPGQVLPMGPVTFTWNDASATAYRLMIGRSFGGDELYDAELGPALSATVNGLPEDGSTIWVRLYSALGDGWLFVDHPFTAAALSRIVSPAPGGTLPGVSVTFSWESGPSDARYQLQVGRSQEGRELYDGRVQDRLSATVSGLPLDGGPVWVRLRILTGGVAHAIDHMYLAGTGQRPREPRPGPTVSQPSGMMTQSIVQVPVDFNSDGQADLVWRNVADGTQALWYMYGTSQIGSSWLDPAGPLGWRIAGVADFNADSRPDLLWQNDSSGEVAVWLYYDAVRLETSYLEPGNVGPDTNWRVVGVDDFNRDGSPDLLLHHRVSGALNIWYMDGLRRVATSAAPGGVADVTWQVVGVGDFTNDGRPDIVWRDSVSGQVAVWFMWDDVHLDGAVLSPTNSSVDWKVVAVGDINGDVQPDLIWRRDSTGELAAWRYYGTTFLDGGYLTPDRYTNLDWRVVGISGSVRVGSQVDPPVVTPGGGTFNEPQALVMTSPTESATVHYTFDGSVPTLYSPSYAGPVSIASGATVRARAFRSGWIASDAVTNAYVFEARPPLISPGGGVYTLPQSVTLTNVSAGATIRYTTDGSVPDLNAPAYTGPILVARGTTLRAAAFRSGWTTSAPASATYVFSVAPPVFDPSPGSYPSNPSIALGTSTVDATIRYTQDGSDPHAGSPVYMNPLSFQPSVVTLKARAFRDGWTDSEVQGGTYTLGAVAPTPVASPPAGTYDIGQSVTLSTADPGVAMFYTLDGSEPTAASAHYNGPIVLTAPGRLKARAYKPDHAASAVLDATYAIRAAPPTMTPEAGDYDPMPQVTIATANPGATIRYTTDRNEPTEASPVYPGPFVVGSDMTVKAQAFQAGWAASLVTTQTYLSSLPVESGSPAVVTSTGVSETGLNTVGGSITFLVSGAALSSDPADAWVYHNGRRVPAAQVQSFTDRVGVQGILAEGRNKLELEALDSNGYLVYDTRTIWAGSRTLTVTVLTASGTALAGATVTASLEEAGSVTASGSTSSDGRASLVRLPISSVVTVRAEAAGYRPASLTLPAGQTTATLTLDLANNDFSQDLSGWTIGTTYAYTLDHSEASQPLVACPDCATRPSGGSSVASSDQPALAVGTEAGAATMSATTVDRDVVIDTKNQFGAQSVTRRFRVAPGTTEVAVRYRFQSDERRIGQLTGSYANDWYDVVIRTIGAGGQARDTQTVSSLWYQFDGNHATPWYTLRLPVTIPTDTVEVTLTAANAIDNAYLGLLFADIVQETVQEITAFELNALHHPTDPYRDVRPITPLDYVSASPHAAHLTSYEGLTRFHGTVTVHGPATDSLQDVWLEIVEGTTIVRADLARAAVSPARSALIGQPFGPDGEISLPASTLLFELSPAQAALFNQDTDRNDLLARVVSLTTSGVRRERRLDRLVSKLVQYTNTNRTPGTSRDLGDCALSATATNRRNRSPYPCGGDSWVLPSVRALIGLTPTTMTWNDFSKMNGGLFPPHLGHQAGDKADGSYPAYRNRDAVAAETMLTGLGFVADRIEMVLVAYTRTEGNAFWKAIRDKWLGRRCAREVIRPDAAHTTWFDLRLGNPADLPPTPRSSCWPEIQP